MIISPNDYQQAACDNALSIFRYALEQIEAAPDEKNRKRAAAYNGCALIQAPTGSGKTLMAGMIAEAFSRETKIVWFWFTPFSGLVDQASIALKKQFGGRLRVRDIQADRLTMGTQSGDVFVATWAAVAAKNENSRKLRKDGDLSLSLDALIPSLRELGFHIGVVVDEAHHTFSGATEAVRFYNEIMQPEFTLMITATPDDKDADKFKHSTGIEVMHRITVSREDAIKHGVIKEGVKSVMYVQGEGLSADLPLTALRDGKTTHDKIKALLATREKKFVPLMLVQVASDNKDEEVAQARAKLILLGFADTAIASYTAKEPTNDLLAVALDEKIEVLIFKMAAAIGFDAPRAFTLVSMRGAKDVDFGIQVVGRILRVHQSLQKKDLPELLRNGYVFLANKESQSGLMGAAAEINRVRTELSAISPCTMLVNIAGQNTVQVVKNGQSVLLETTSQNADEIDELPIVGLSQLNFGNQGVLDGFLFADNSQQTEEVRRVQTQLNNYTKFPLKVAGLRFKKECSPIETKNWVADIVKKVSLGDRELNAGRRENTNITRHEIEIFSGSGSKSNIQASLSANDIFTRAQGVLTFDDSVDAGDLQTSLIKRLQTEYMYRGWATDNINQALSLILASFPNLIRKAKSEVSAQYIELIDCVQLPEYIELPANTSFSSLNIYGVMPPDLNNDELIFAEMLDSDLSDTVEWWHRNEVKKPWSIALILPNGHQYFPDFVVKVKDRTLGGGILLVEVKGGHLLNASETLDKSQAQHKTYRSPLMVSREKDGRFMTVVYNEKTGLNEHDKVFRVSTCLGS
jgi:superfamily II DNA or RNA helicase